MGFFLFCIKDILVVKVVVFIWLFGEVVSVFKIGGILDIGIR